MSKKEKTLLKPRYKSIKKDLKALDKQFNTINHKRDKYIRKLSKLILANKSKKHDYNLKHVEKYEVKVKWIKRKLIKYYDAKSK